jgi:protein-disulfide isomerase
MPSGKRSRTKRQAPPPPPVSTRRRQASPRVLLVGGVLAVVAVVIVVALLVTRGNSSHTASDVPSVGSLANALPGATETHALLKGVPQNGLTLGSAHAPATMVEYVDLQCPYCQQFETQVMPDVVRKYVRPGKLRIELRPWAFLGPDSFRGQAAVLAASQQKKAFNLAAILYDNQGTENTGWLDDSMVIAAAKSVPGLLVRRLLTDQSSSTVKAQAQTIDTLAREDHVNSTPTIMVGPTGAPGKVVHLQAPTDEATLARAIRSALASQA